MLSLTSSLTCALDQHAGNDGRIHKEDVGAVLEILMLQDAVVEIDANVIEPPGGLEQARVFLVDQGIVIIKEQFLRHDELFVACCVCGVVGVDDDVSTCVHVHMCCVGVLAAWMSLIETLAK